MQKELVHQVVSDKDLYEEVHRRQATWVETEGRPVTYVLGRRIFTINPRKLK